MADSGQALQWWQRGIIYQVYPRSFQDANGDGVGDLKGITERLDYLKWLGIRAVWISPIFPSPMADFGYDISDYTGIDSLFGDMNDFDDLLAAIHARDMKLILDLVPNHTSEQHPWFLESKSSRHNPKRDWYIWKDPSPDGTPPNNWLAMFGGSAWEWDEATGQYYYHAFLKEQPDLNWRNPEVRKAMYDVMRFWLDKGVDGFRVDVMWHLIKDNQFRNNPANPNYKPEQATYEQLLPVYSTDQPEVHDIVREMRQVLDEYQERMMIGEIYLPIHKLIAYYGPQNDGAQLPFNFLLLSLPWEPLKIAAGIAEYEGALPHGAWPNWVLGNHDQPRISSRVGQEQSKIAAMLLLTLRGTPTIYYGEETGMKDVPIPRDEIRDPQGLNMPDKNLSRDPQRTPMQWDDSLNAGFSVAKPWLRIGQNYKRLNVAREQTNAFSQLSFYHKLIALRQQEAALTGGAFLPLYADTQAMVYLRQLPGAATYLIALNFSHRPCYISLNPNRQIKGMVSIATTPELEGAEISNTMELSGDEGIIAALED